MQLKAISRVGFLRFIKLIWTFIWKTKIPNIKFKKLSMAFESGLYNVIKHISSYILAKLHDYNCWQ